MNKNSKIYIAGHRGLVGSAIVKNLESKDYTNLVFRTHEELDLTNQKAVEDFFESEKPQYVILAAAKVGGIVANNTYRADFIYENLAIQNNVIHQSYKHNVTKLLFLGSTCIYPKNAPQPMPENCLLFCPGIFFSPSAKRTVEKMSVPDVISGSSPPSFRTAQVTSVSLLVISSISA